MVKIRACDGTELQRLHVQCTHLDSKIWTLGRKLARLRHHRLLLPGHSATVVASLVRQCRCRCAFPCRQGQPAIATPAATVCRTLARKKGMRRKEIGGDEVEEEIEGGEEAAYLP
jgi:hypothetical protein